MRHSFEMETEDLKAWAGSLNSSELIEEIEDLELEKNNILKTGNMDAWNERDQIQLILEDEFKKQGFYVVRNIELQTVIKDFLMDYVGKEFIKSYVKPEWNINEDELLQLAYEKALIQRQNVYYFILTSFQFHLIDAFSQLYKRHHHVRNELTCSQKIADMNVYSFMRAFEKVYNKLYKLSGKAHHQIMAIWDVFCYELERRGWKYNHVESGSHDAEFFHEEYTKLFEHYDKERVLEVIEEAVNFCKYSNNPNQSDAMYFYKLEMVSDYIEINYFKNFEMIGVYSTYILEINQGRILMIYGDSDMITVEMDSGVKYYLHDVYEPVTEKEHVISHYLTKIKELEMQLKII